MGAPNRKLDIRPWLKAMNFVTNHHDTYPFIDPSRVNLAGKSMLITGASKGIGRMTAIHFAQAGCSKIALAARSDLTEVANACKEAAAKAGHTEPSVLLLNVDVSSEASVKAAAETVGREFDGKLDVLITNAGYLEAWKPITETDPGEWWKTWNVNINGTFLCMHYFLPMVLSSETKTLITISSAGGHNLNYGASSYQTTKFATCRLTEFADAEYGDRGLIAIALHPGGIKTELAHNMPAEMQAILIDELELPADVIVWLAAEPRGWLSGRYISACWDIQELEGKKEEIIAKDLLKFRMVI